MTLNLSEVWNELIVPVRAIGKDLSNLKINQIPNPLRASSLLELIAQTNAFESILNGLPGGHESTSRLLLSALGIVVNVRHYVSSGAENLSLNDLPEPLKSLYKKTDDLDAIVNGIVRKLPESFRVLFLSDSLSVGGVNVADLEEGIERLQKRQKANESRQSDIDRSISELGVRVEKKFEQFELKAESAFTAMRSEFDIEGKNLLSVYEAAKEQLATRTKAMDQLFGVLAAKALGGGYMRNALKEERLADGFRNTAVVLMVALGVYLVGAIASMEIKAIDPAQAVVRGTGALFFSFVIGYLIRQSAVHRAQQHRYQRTALDLKAIDPFLADLPPEARQAVKLQLADKIFVPKDVLAASDAAGFGWAELAMKAMDKAKSTREKSS